MRKGILSVVMCSVGLCGSALLAQSQAELFDRLKIPDGNALCEIDLKGMRSAPVFASLKSAGEKGPASGMKEYNEYTKIFEKHGLKEGDLNSVIISARASELGKMPMLSPAQSPFEMADMLFALSIEKQLTLAQLEALSKDLAKQEQEDIEFTKEKHKSFELLITKPKKATTAGGPMGKELAWSIIGDGKVILGGFPVSVRGALDRIQAKAKSGSSAELEKLRASLPKASQFTLLVDMPKTADKKAEPPPPAQPMNPMTMAADALKDIKALSVNASLSDKIDVGVSGCFNNPKSAATLQNVLSSMLLPMLKMQIPMRADGKMTRMAETLKSESGEGTPIVRISWEMSQSDIELMQQGNTAAMAPTTTQTGVDTGVKSGKSPAKSGKSSAGAAKAKPAKAQ